MGIKNLKRLLSLLLCLCLVTSLLPVTAGAITADGTVNATIYTGRGDSGAFTGETSTFAVDQTGLILDLRSFSQTIPEGWTVSSLAFYPIDNSSEWGTVFWYSDITNGRPNDKLASNGVFQLLNFRPNGNMELTPGKYQVLAYVGGTGSSGKYEEMFFLSSETFEITGAMGPGEPVINTTTLPTAYVGETYSQALSATPGTTGNTLTWSVSSGTLPDDLQLDTNSGTISGTPTAAGSYTFTVQVSEAVEGSDPLTATRELTLKVTKKLEITNTDTSFNLNRGEQVNIPLTANLEGVTWKIASGTLPGGLNLLGGAITGTVSSYADSGNYQVTVQASADGQTATKEFTFQIGDLFRFTLDNNIDSDAMGRYAYLRATEGNRDITLWGGTLKADTQNLMINSGFAGAEVSNVRLITYAGSTEAVLAEYTGSVTLTDGQNATLTGKGDNVLVKLPEITHSYGEDAYIQTWFQESGSSSYKTYQPGTIVAATTEFTLHASAGCSGADDPLAEYDLTTATFTGEGVSGTTYTPADNSNAEAITVSYTKYSLQTVTVTLTPTTGDAPDLSYAKLTFSQRFDRWTYSADAVVGKDNTCTVQLYPGVEGWITMTNAGSYALSSTTIEANSISGNTLTLNVYGAEERSMAVMVTGKLEDEDNADLAAYAAALGGSSYLWAETGGKSWRATTAYLSTLLKGSNRVGLWNNSYSAVLSDLVKNSGTLKLSYGDGGPLLENCADITWEQNSLTATVDLPISLRGGVLFDLDYQGQNSILMKGWWHQTATDEDTGEEYDVWVVGQSKTAYTGTYAKNNTVAQYCPGDPGEWDFLLLPSIASPSGMTWAEALEAYPGMPYKAGVTIEDNTVVKLDKQTLEARAANSLLYLTLPNSTFTGPQQFDTTGDTLVFSGHIELDEGKDNQMKILRLDAAGTDAGSRVSTQISSVVINGKEYPYTQIQLEDGSNYEADTLVSVQFQTYYQIVFEEPMELPCDITVYGKPMTANSAAVLDLSVLLTDKSSYEPVDRVEVSAPSVSVEMPGTVGDRTFTAYVTIPEGGRVDVYDGIDLVGQARRTGDIKIALSGASDSMITSHDLRFVLFDEEGKEAGAYTQTVLHANGAPTLRSQSLQTTTDGKYWTTHTRDRIYSFTSSNPPQFRAICTFDNAQNLKAGSVVFAVSLLDGTIRYMEGKADGTKVDTFVTDTITTSSPVIGITVLYEIDWDKVNQIILTALPVPSDSPTATGYNFDQTIVLNYADFKEELPTTIPSQDTQWTTEQRQAIEAIQDQIELIYTQHGGSAGYYTIIGDGSEFYSGQYMIEHLDPSVLPEDYIGETTFTRPLTQGQFEGELGGGEGWTRLTFTEPGETSGGWGGAGAGGEIGLEIYTTEFTTGSGVDGTLTITRIGEGDGAAIYETGFATAQGTGTSGGTPTELPASGTINPGDATFGSGEWFSFTNFEGPSDMEVFTNFCDDVNAQSGIAGSLLQIAGMEGAVGGWELFGGVVNIVGAGKSMYDGLSNDASLQELHASTMSLLDSPCAQKLQPNVRANLQSQLDRFNDMAVEAMQWNTIVTLGGTGTGLAGAIGIMSNPFTALTAGIGLFGAGKINRQQMDNVRMEAQLARDNVQFQITKYAIASGDTDCAPKPKSSRNAGSSGSSTYRVCIDPSGIVYEAVLSNPVEGATVTLYTADGTYVPTYAKDGDFEVYVDQDGKPIAPNNAESYPGQGSLTVPDVNDLDPKELTLTTGPDGRYQWMVPPGLWYVTAEKGEDGYLPGSSNSDVAAVVAAGGKNWLPVLPAQLDVNIPLVSYDIPTVTAEYRADGVYLTFSKYMDNETLKEQGAFKIGNTEVDPDDVELLNSEQAPANIKYSGDAPWYTSQVKLTTSTTLTGDVAVTIGSGVKSYAGVPCTTKTDGLTLSGEVAAETPVATPTFSKNSGQVAYGSTVTITIPDGATVYYTTDGTAPTLDSNGQPTGSTTRYYANQTIAIDRDMTINVLAVKPGYKNATASASFTVPTDKNVTIGDDYEQPGTDPGTNPSGGGGVSGYAISVPSSSSIQGGTVTVSPKQAAKGTTVTITVKPDQGYELDTLTVTDAKGNELTLTDAGGGKYTFTMPGTNVKIDVSFRKAVPIWASCTGGAECPAHLFTDVNTSAWYHEAVDYVLVNGLMSGYGNGLFGPDDILSRAQLCQIIYNMEGQPATSGSSVFTDVADSAWYADAVTWAAENGIVGGYGGGLFGPEDNITREQLASILYRYAQTKGYDTSVGENTNILSYTDALEISEYAIPAMKWACGAGVIMGVTESALLPQGSATRAQVATMLMRFCEYYADTK